MAGADSFIGGGGLNTVSYAHATAGIIMDLGATGLYVQIGDQVGVDGAHDAITVGADGKVSALDTYTDIQNIIGSNNNDTLAGDSLANIIDGGEGRDAIYGGDGADTIYATRGNDTVDAGNNNDTIHASSPVANLPTAIDGGADDGGSGDILVLQDLVDGVGYDLTSLANLTTNVETLDISGDGVSTALAITGLEIQHMVNDGSASELTIKVNSGDTLDLSAFTAASETYSANVLDANHTDYTISNGGQIALIHWDVVA